MENNELIKIAVTQQIISMLQNDIVNQNGIESSKGWCEDGDVFYTLYESKFGKEFCEECTKLMDDVSTKVDNIVFNFLGSY